MDGYAVFGTGRFLFWSYCASDVALVLGLRRDRVATIEKSRWEKASNGRWSTYNIGRGSDDRALECDGARHCAGRFVGQVTDVDPTIRVIGE